MIFVTLIRSSPDYDQKITGLATPVDLVFVDITKAFDSVPHEALLNLIKHLGASNNVLRSIQQLHEEPKGTIQGTAQHFTCKRGVRQGSREGPSLFNLFLQEILKEVFPHGDNNGVPLTTLDNKEQWTLQHLEYADDLVLAADSPEIAQDLVTRLVTTLRKYNMKIAPTKTVWMHIGGDEVPEALTVEGERIVRV